MSNSPLITCSRYPRIKKSNPRKYKIQRITIHHWSGVKRTAQDCLDYFCSEDCMRKRQVSSNYVIGNDGSIGMMIPESERAWTSSNAENDHSAVTIEVSNSVASGKYPISDAAMKSLILLCADICRRNGIKSLYYDGTKSGTLTRHCQFSQTDCPGAYIKEKTTYICTEVNKLIGSATLPVSTPTGGNPYIKPTMVLNANNAAYGRKYGGHSSVKWIHWELSRLGYYSGDIDGYFGPMTVAAVKGFQEDHKDQNGNQLEADGSVGPLTREALASAKKVSKSANPYPKPTMILNKNNSAYGKKYAGTSQVKWIHWQLTQLGLYHDSIDGYFGPKTVEAVKQFQRSHKDANGKQLEADGSVGPLTREALDKAV